MSTRVVEVRNERGSGYVLTLTENGDKPATVKIDTVGSLLSKQVPMVDLANAIEELLR